MYWGNYINDRDAAVKDFNTRDAETPPEIADKETIWEKYICYLQDWADSHNTLEFYGMSPACFDEWRNNEYRGDDDDDENNIL